MQLSDYAGKVLALSECLYRWLGALSGLDAARRLKLAAYADERGKTSIIPGWVGRFGDRVFHHVAVRVEDIEAAIAKLKGRGVVFTGEIVGARGGTLRQIFTAPEMVDGHPFSVLELAERHQGYQGFLPPQADSLMKSSAARA